MKSLEMFRRGRFRYWNDVNPDGIALVERIELDTQAYAVMPGGPERRHLFISASGFP